ncbi:MAG TPA: hypothetical protein VEU74_12110 [Gemmatimonadales bacterium]|nr:hypothetical protein [Gemmatimonadales bacterium]
MQAQRIQEIQRSLEVLQTQANEFLTAIFLGAGIEHATDVRMVSDRKGVKLVAIVGNGNRIVRGGQGGPIPSLEPPPGAPVVELK